MSGSGDEAAMAILAEAHGRRDPARVEWFARAIAQSAQLWGAAPPRLTSAYREAKYGDPGYQARDQNLVTASPKVVDVNFERSQIVLLKPRVVIYRIAPLGAQAGFGAESMKLRREQLVVIHQGIYEGDERAAPMIAADVFQKHAHEEALEPTTKRIDVISLQMPEDGGYRVFRREGSQLVEKRVAQQQKGTILRGLPSVRERAA